MSINMLKKFAVSCALIAGCATTAWSDVTVLTFEGIADQQEIGNYYNGGAGGDYGISFLPGALALVSETAGGYGNFEGGSSGVTIIFFLNSNSAVMNVADGFTDGFSFYYAAYQPGNVTVYDGLNATGNVLATFELQQTVFGEEIESWMPVGVNFSGTAFSVSFAGAANQIGFDDITIGSANAGGTIPEPSTYAALLGAAALVGVWAARRRRTTNT